MGNIRYYRTAQRITSAVKCRPLKQLPPPIPISAPPGPESIIPEIRRHRALRPDGIWLHDIPYWSNALSGQVGRAKSELLIKFDPRDVSRIFVQHPDGRFLEARAASRFPRHQPAGVDVARVTYPKAIEILGHLNALLKHPRTTRMPSLAVYGDSGMGKSMLVEKFNLKTALGRFDVLAFCDIARCGCVRWARDGAGRAGGGR